MTQESAVLERWQQALLTGNTTYAGVPVVKAPTDFFALQMLVFEHRPHWIIEIGNWQGGMLLAYSHWQRTIGGKGWTIGIDVAHDQLHPSFWQLARKGNGITLRTGRASDVFKAHLAGDARPEQRHLIVDDGSHTYDDTLEHLRLFSSLCNPGDWYVVEDTICHHGLDVGPNPGPYEAVETFLAEDPSWQRDRRYEDLFGMTWNPGGWLKKL